MDTEQTELTPTESEPTNGASEPGFAVPTRDQARAKRDQERAGYWMPLPKTGGFAHVRRLSMADKSTLAGMPFALQSQALEVFRELATVPEARDVAQWNKNLAKLERTANMICVVGFIKPRLVLTDDELDPDDPYCWLVSDLHIEERVGYANIVTGVDQAAMKNLVPFRDDPAGGDVGAVPTGEPAAAAVGPAGDARGRSRRDHATRV